VLLRQRVHDEVCERGYNSEIGSFVQSYGRERARCEPAADGDDGIPAAVGSAHPRHHRGDSSAACSSTGFCFVTTPGPVSMELPPGEGAFLACTLWLADAYVLLGRADDARRVFERLLTLRNDVGLLSEE
jgi:GH15 family glucan-1,4-alpha-glucosidase